VTILFLGLISTISFTIWLLSADCIHVHITVLHPSLCMAFFEDPDHWDLDIADRA
jgi:hypothetical protein